MNGRKEKIVPLPKTSPSKLLLRSSIPHLEPLFGQFISSDVVCCLGLFMTWFVLSLDTSQSFSEVIIRQSAQCIQAGPLDEAMRAGRRSWRKNITFSLPRRVLIATSRLVLVLQSLKMRIQSLHVWQRFHSCDRCPGVDISKPFDKVDHQVLLNIFNELCVFFLPILSFPSSGYISVAVLDQSVYCTLASISAVRWRIYFGPSNCPCRIPVAEEMAMQYAADNNIAIRFGKTEREAVDF